MSAALEQALLPALPGRTVRQTQADVTHESEPGSDTPRATFVPHLNVVEVERQARGGSSVTPAVTEEAQPAIDGPGIDPEPLTYTDEDLD